jgi:Uma2 family endonuclease
MSEMRLNVDEFFAWAEDKEGHWELHDGAPKMMAAERVLHTSTKGDAAIALHMAIKTANSRCRAFVSGITVRIGQSDAFVPDALVLQLPLPSLDEVAISNPLVVVEVLSPSTLAYDHGIKLEGYFSLPSLAHYLILDFDRRVVIHHARGRGDVIETRILHEGLLRLDPPGIEVAIADFFASAD